MENKSKNSSSIIKPRTTAGVSRQWCVAIDCSSDNRKRGRYGYMADVDFYPFPSKTKNAKLRKKWLEHLKRDGYEPKSSHSVCSKHFVDGKPTEINPIPTLFAFNNFGFTPSKRSSNAIQKRESLSKTTSVDENDNLICYEDLDFDVLPWTPSTTATEQENVLSNAGCHDALETVVTPLPSKEVTVRTQIVNTQQRKRVNIDLQYYESFGEKKNPDTDRDHCYFKQNRDVADAADKSIQTDVTSDTLDQDLNRAQEELKELKAIIDNKDSLLRKLFVEKVMKTDMSVKQYTGVPTKSLLKGLFVLLDDNCKNVKYWRGQESASQKNYQNSDKKKPGPARKLSRHDEYLITLIKLRNAVPNFMLSNIFGVSESRVSQIFTTWINVMHNIFSKFIVWPSKESIKKHMPRSFKLSFPKTRAIIDCTEINIEKPRTPTAQSQTYSSYKSHNTFKSLVAISPTGAFTYISDFWGGNVSDRYITTNSGFLDLVSPGDEIMADRGFVIRDLVTERKATLNIPPFTRKVSWGKGKRLNSIEVKKTKAIAKQRIHVERAIGRLKNFKMLANTLSLKYKPVSNQMLKVAGFLCNLGPPLVKK